MALQPWKSFERLAQINPDTLGGVLLFVGCDLEYACNVLGLIHFNNTANCCADCNANFDTVPLNNFHRTSAWRATVRNNEEYLAALRQPRHPLVAHAWFTKFAYRQDLLHNFDHHGLTSHIIGNVLWCHVSSDRLCNVFPGNTTDERLDFMNDDIRAFYSAQRVNNRLPTLKASNLKKSDNFPVLHGNGIKAANTKALVPYILDVQNEPQNPLVAFNANTCGRWSNRCTL